MRVKHPYALDDDAPSPDDVVHWGGRREWSDVDEDGTFYVPDSQAEQFVDSWPEADGYSVADLRVDESGPSNGATDGTADGSESDDAGADDDLGGPCEAVKTDGEVCGRSRPCPYHDRED